MTQPLFTSEVFARRVLCFAPDERVVTWAENMVLAGFDSPHLSVLLGEIAPFNAFEIDDMLGRIHRELGAPQIGSSREAIEIVATAYVRRVALGWIDRRDALSVLGKLFLEDCPESTLADFYYLNWAATSLADWGYQYYWPGADADNIDEIIAERFDAWSASHPIKAWSAHEWCRIESG